VTACGSGLEVEARAAGARHVFGKPIDFPTLLAAVVQSLADAN
jgi:hypothetical protein